MPNNSGMEQKTPKISIKKACKSVCGQAALARLIGVAPPTVNQWVSGHRQVPAERCPEIEKATHGAVTCEELRPDVDWAYLRGTRRDGDRRAAVGLDSD